MEEAMLDFLKNIIIGIIIAVFSSGISIFSFFISSKISRKQYNQQKWWDKKNDVYSEIIANLSYLQYYFSEFYDEGVNIKSIEKEKRKEMFKKFDSVNESLMKIIYSSNIFISEDTIKALEDLFSELDKRNKDGNWVNDLDRYFSSTKTCLKKIKELAKEDLTV